MSDGPRIYSDEEFALVLRKAAELGRQAEPALPSSTGLTLTEMKAAAAQVGFDPALVERAARMLATTVALSPFERLIGGPMRHERQTRFPVMLDDTTAARLLSAVRVGSSLAGRQDVGHSSAVGMTWHDGGDTQPLSVTARPDESDVGVSVVLDRRGTLGMVALISGILIFFTVIIATFALYPVAPALGIGGFIAGVTSILTVARRYWVSSTRKARERIGVVMDAIDRTLMRPESKP
ncbi:MAG: hypothetical protein V4558_13660 [Gemmatimonadota bacterium]